MFEWDDARYVLALHRASSLSAAARSLGVNQTTVGRRIAVIEERLGVRLFLKVRDGYTLAPAGERMVARAERMEAEADGILREIAGQDTQLAGSVRVSAPDPFAAHVVVPMLAEFHERYPQIELELNADNRTVSLSKRETDIALRVIKRPNEEGLIGRRLGDYAFAPYASRRYVEARGIPDRSNAHGHQFVSHDDSMRSRHGYARFEAWAARGQTVFRSGTTHVRLAAARASLGIAFLPCYLGDFEPELVRVGPRDTPMAALWLLMHRDLRDSARLRASADFLARSLREVAWRFAGTAAPSVAKPPER